MKKLIVLLLALLVIFTINACCLNHDWKDATCTEPKTCTKCGAIEGEALCPFIYRQTGDLLTITDYVLECGGEFVIPEQIDGKVVAAIEERAFSGRNDIVKLTVPETVIAIGEYAFENCKNLENVYMPGAADCDFNHTTFYNCSKLTGIDTKSGILTGFNDNVGAIVGTFDKEESVKLQGMNTHPFKPIIPVRDCVGFTLDMTIKEYNGDPFGMWIVYAREGSGEWKNIAEYEMHEDKAGQAETFTFRFDEPISFDSLVVVQKGSEYHGTSYSVKFYDAVCHFSIDGK